MPKLKLYGHHDSGHVYKVMLFLELKSLSYTYEQVDIWAKKSSRPSKFLANSRDGQVPLLLIDDQPYIQSNLILYKLASLYKCFGGENEKRLLDALEWQFWEANKIGMCVPQLRYAKKFAPEEFTQDSLNFLKNRFNEDIETLNKQLSNGHKFILDDNPSIADFSISGYLFWADEAGLKLPIAVNNWLKHISQLKGWKPPNIMMKR